MKTIRFTKEGYQKLQDTYQGLLNERPLAVADLKKARDMGDLSENGYYKAARMKLSSLDSQIFHAKMQLRQAKVIVNTKVGLVSIGSTVIITDGEEEKVFSIVGDYEADPKKNMISARSPIGKALVGKRVGEEAIIHAPAGEMRYKVVKIK